MGAIIVDIKWWLYLPVALKEIELDNFAKTLWTLRALQESNLDTDLHGPSQSIKRLRDKVVFCPSRK